MCANALLPNIFFINIFNSTQLHSLLTALSMPNFCCVKSNPCSRKISLNLLIQKSYLKNDNKTLDKTYLYSQFFNFANILQAAFLKSFFCLGVREQKKVGNRCSNLNTNLISDFRRDVSIDERQISVETTCTSDDVQTSILLLSICRLCNCLFNDHVFIGIQMF